MVVFLLKSWFWDCIGSSGKAPGRFPPLLIEIGPQETWSTPKNVIPRYVFCSPLPSTCSNFNGRGVNSREVFWLFGHKS